MADAPTALNCDDPSPEDADLVHIRPRYSLFSKNYALG